MLSPERRPSVVVVVVVLLVRFFIGSSSPVKNSGKSSLGIFALGGRLNADGSFPDEAGNCSSYLWNKIIG